MRMGLRPPLLSFFKTRKTKIMGHFDKLQVTTLEAGSVSATKGVKDGNVSGEEYVTLDSATTLALATHSVQVGKVVRIQGGDVTLTLPAVTVGASFHIVNDNNDGGGALTISPNASDKFLVDIAGAAGTDNKDIVNTKATAKRGDYVKLIGLSANGWLIEEIRGTWVDEA